MKQPQNRKARFPKPGGPRGWKLPVAFLCPIMAAGFACAQAEPAPLPLWTGHPPEFVEGAPAETVDKNGNIANVSNPAITVYLPPKDRSTGMALIVCPGGSYRLLGWAAHVAATARYFNPRGIAVVGLKYRTNPPNKISPENRNIPLMDVKRAVRTVRSHAAEWNIDPHKIGVLGYSAGANLAMTLASQFDGGDSRSDDPVERLDCRPDFVVSCSTWHWRQKTSPFIFPKNTPPAFLIHAADDRVAPIELPYAIKAQLESLGVPVHMEAYPEGGHGVGHLIPQLIERNYPPTKWPERLLEWLDGPGSPPRDPAKSDPAGRAGSPNPPTCAI